MQPFPPNKTPAELGLKVGDRVVAVRDYGEFVNKGDVLELQQEGSQMPYVKNITRNIETCVPLDYCALPPDHPMASKEPPAAPHSHRFTVPLAEEYGHKNHVGRLVWFRDIDETRLDFVLATRRVTHLGCEGCDERKEVKW